MAGLPTGHDVTIETLDNDRVRVWELPGASSRAPGPHRHVHETVVVWFAADGRPRARYLERGLVHDADAPADATRAFAFEIK